MTRRAPLPWLASWLLCRVHEADAPLVGDILEEYATRRSRLWLWRQILSASWRRLHSVDELRPLRLVDHRITPLRTVSRPLRPLYRIDAVNLSGAPLRGIGGFTIVLIVVVSTLTQPGISLLAGSGVALGGLLGWLLIARSRRRGIRLTELNHVAR